MNLIYISKYENIDFLSSFKFDVKNKSITVFSNVNKKIADNINIIKKDNINKFPDDISCLLTLLPEIKKDDYYFIDFTNNQSQENIEVFLKLSLNDEVFNNNYYFLNQDLKDDVSVCFSNYRDQILFSTRINNILPHGFPLIIKGDSLIFILRFIKIFFDINIFNYNTEGVFALLLKIKHG
jgi:hypothetical protein